MVWIIIFGKVAENVRNSFGIEELKEASWLTLESAFMRDPKSVKIQTFSEAFFQP